EDEEVEEDEEDDEEFDEDGDLIDDDEEDDEDEEKAREWCTACIFPWLRRHLKQSERISPERRAVASFPCPVSGGLPWLLPGNTGSATAAAGPAVGAGKDSCAAAERATHKRVFHQQDQE